MNRLILFEFAVFIFTAISSLSGIVDIQRAGQVLVALGLIDLILGILTWIGVPLIRGDISLLEPITSRDLGARPTEQDSSEATSPSLELVAWMTASGIVAILGGLLWIQFLT